MGCSTFCIILFSVLVGNLLPYINDVTVCGNVEKNPGPDTPVTHAL